MVVCRVWVLDRVRCGGLRWLKVRWREGCRKMQVSGDEMRELVGFSGGVGYNRSCGGGVFG